MRGEEMIEELVHKMYARRLGDGLYDLRINQIPFDVKTRFDDRIGILVFKMNVDFKTIAAFLRKFGPTGSNGRLREAATGQEIEIIFPVGAAFPADVSVTQRITAFFTECTGEGKGLNWEAN
jgi:hypothetical protein